MFQLFVPSVSPRNILIRQSYRLTTPNCNNKSGQSHYEPFVMFDEQEIPIWKSALKSTTTSKAPTPVPPPVDSEKRVKIVERRPGIFRMSGKKKSKLRHPYCENEVLSGFEFPPKVRPRRPKTRRQKSEEESSKTVGNGTVVTFEKPKNNAVEAGSQTNIYAERAKEAREKITSFFSRNNARESRSSMPRTDSDNESLTTIDIEPASAPKSRKLSKLITRHFQTPNVAPLTEEDGSLLTDAEEESIMERFQGLLELLEEMIAAAEQDNQANEARRTKLSLDNSSLQQVEMNLEHEKELLSNFMDCWMVRYALHDVLKETQNKELALDADNIDAMKHQLGVLEYRMDNFRTEMNVVMDVREEQIKKIEKLCEKGKALETKIYELSDKKQKRSTDIQVSQFINESISVNQSLKEAQALDLAGVAQAQLRQARAWHILLDEHAEEDDKEDSTEAGVDHNQLTKQIEQLEMWCQRAEHGLDRVNEMITEQEINAGRRRIAKIAAKLPTECVRMMHLREQLPTKQINEQNRLQLKTRLDDLAGRVADVRALTEARQRYLSLVNDLYKINEQKKLSAALEIAKTITKRRIKGLKTKAALDVDVTRV